MMGSNNCESRWLCVRGYGTAPFNIAISKPLCAPIFNHYCFPDGLLFVHVSYKILTLIFGLLVKRVTKMLFNILEAYHVDDTPTNNWQCTHMGTAWGLHWHPCNGHLTRAPTDYPPFLKTLICTPGCHRSHHIKHKRNLLNFLNTLEILLVIIPDGLR